MRRSDDRERAVGGVAPRGRGSVQVVAAVTRHPLIGTRGIGREVRPGVRSRAVDLDVLGHERRRAVVVPGRERAERQRPGRVATGQRRRRARGRPARRRAGRVERELPDARSR